MKDQQIVDIIRGGNHRKALEKVYLHFPSIRNMILQRGGTKNDAKDIFQESVIIFYENVLKPDFTLTSAISTYLYSVSYNLWMKRIRKVKSKEADLDDTLDLVDDLSESEERIEEEKKLAVIKKVLLDLGKKCKKILLNYYYQQLSMQEIAEDMGYGNDKTAKNQKYRCLQKARELADLQYGEGKEVLI